MISMFDFNDKVVLITGASGGLGPAVVRAFQAAGAALALNASSQESLQAAFPGMDTGRHLLAPADITSETAVADLAETIRQRYGRVDVLAHLAGGFKAGTAVADTPAATWDHMMNLNARSAFLVSRAILPLMRPQPAGAILFIGSRAATGGAAKMAAYSAAKTAVVRLAESLAAEMKGQGISVNCLLPGTIDTAANRKAMPKADTGQWVTPAQIARVMLFLASDWGTAVHGAVIPVYGTP